MLLRWFKKLGYRIHAWTKTPRLTDADKRRRLLWAKRSFKIHLQKQNDTKKNIKIMLLILVELFVYFILGMKTSLLRRGP